MELDPSPLKCVIVDECMAGVCVKSHCCCHYAATLKKKTMLGGGGRDALQYILSTLSVMLSMLILRVSCSYETHTYVHTHATQSYVFIRYLVSILESDIALYTNPQKIHSYVMQFWCFYAKVNICKNL